MWGGLRGNVPYLIAKWDQGFKCTIFCGYKNRRWMKPAFYLSYNCPFQHKVKIPITHPVAQEKALMLLLLLLLLLLSHVSRVRLCATPSTAAHQVPSSLGFSRQEHWSGLPFPSPMHESEKWKWSRSVVSDSLRPHGLHPTRLLGPWDFPGKSTGVGCHCLLRFKIIP